MSTLSYTLKKEGGNKGLARKKGTSGERKRTTAGVGSDEASATAAGSPSPEAHATPEAGEAAGGSPATINTTIENGKDENTRCIAWLVLGGFGDVWRCCDANSSEFKGLKLAHVRQDMQDMLKKHLVALERPLAWSNPGNPGNLYPFNCIFSPKHIYIYTPYHHVHLPWLGCCCLSFTSGR